MYELHKGARRGHSNHGWLDSHHSFTFADHYDPDNMAFRSLRVINEDRIAGGTGFGTHGHRDMEIISYVLDGALAHKDSMGNGSVMLPGDVQRMSAGTGITHSEFNHLPKYTTHFLQIWIEPQTRGLPAGYEQKYFSADDKRGRLRLILSPDGRDGSLVVHQDALVYAGLFDGAESAHHAIAPGRSAYLHVARGELSVNGHALFAGDALKVSGEPLLTLAGGDEAEVLLFDLA